jgi:hypothetical protein
MRHIALGAVEGMSATDYRGGVERDLGVKMRVKPPLNAQAGNALTQTAIDLS